MKIAFLGTGLMGEPMAFRLLKANYNLYVFNRTISKTERLKKHQAKIFTAPEEAIKEPQLIITMLTDYNAIVEVLFRNKSNFKGKTLIQMSTIAPQESLLLKERIEQSGGEYIEAPVLGSTQQAESGELIVMVGGNSETFNRLKKILKNFGNSVIHVGDVGKASALKLALNQLIPSLLSAFATSLAYVNNKGIDINIFMEILRKSALYAPTFDKKLPNMLKRDFDKANFPLKHMLKDINLIYQEFQNNNVNTQLVECVRNILIKSVDANLSDKDYSALYNIIHPEK
ncbi:MAG: NAD(P)-dependent oxidoreductase [Melioribacter sp.]|uniref:NAD(P)-dependent oxidoreductase n=1 Tax=Rosettibacter primus TaxID=3111523 RepID=UPI00247E72C3|nr:NAD(P)-dependent oxidoreductase [Melioribacter sp.]